MSYHILHLLSHRLRVRVKLDQLQIEDRDKGTQRTVPLADVAVIVAASPDLTVTAGALRRMADLGVVMLVCDEHFEPCCLNLPYYRATNTELLRRQIEWTSDWKQALWRQIIVAKIRNQAAVLIDLRRAHNILTEIAHRCACPQSLQTDGTATGDEPAMALPPPAMRPEVSLANLSPARRRGLHSDSPDACESRAARHYWKYLLPRLSRRQGEEESRRVPRTRDGVNGMLDYGYAIIRSAVLRSLASHGFIAAVGIAHANKAGSFALADDLVEPIRPFVDRELRRFLERGPRTMEAWMKQVVHVLALELPLGRARVRLLNAIDLYIRSFAAAAMARTDLPLTFPMIP